MLDKQEKDWHREIDVIVKNLKANADILQSTSRAVLEKFLFNF